MKPFNEMSVEELHKHAFPSSVHEPYWQPTLDAFDELARRLEEQEQVCICKGNWRNIIKKTEPLFGRRYRETYTGDVYSLTGVVHAEDDYYYLMFNPATEKCQLLSCVGDITDMGYELLPEEHK